MTQENEASSLCECTKGFIQNDKHTCDVAHGYPCSFLREDLPCAKRLRLYRQLGNNGSNTMVQFCSCPNLGDIYDEAKKKCVTLLGVACV